MGRKRKGRKINGWINLDKPFDMTSTQAVGKVRWLLKAQKAGHGGTLDPLATGILPIALGEATKTIPWCQDHLKTYLFTVKWGEQRTTDDAEGEIIETSDARPDREDITGILPRFTGEIEQIPPQFSAVKIDGQRAYDLARDGETVEIDPRPVYIEKLELVANDIDTAKFRCLCGKGTYVRSLARDMAQILGTVGYIAELRRESVGPFTAENAISLAKLEEIMDSAAADDAGDEIPAICEEVLLPVQTVLDDIPALALNQREATLLRNGQKLSFISRSDVERLENADIQLSEETTALALYNGKPVALVAVRGVEIQPQKVFNLF